MPLKLIGPIIGRTPYWYIRGTLHGRTIYASTKARDKASARRFKEQFEIKLAKTAGQKYRASTFGEAAELYLTFREPRKTDRRAIDRMVAIIGETPLADVRQHTLVRVADTLHPDCAPETKNRMVMAIAAAVLHYASDNDLCPYIRVKKFKERAPEPRALSQGDAAKLINAADGKMKLLLTFLFCQGWRISDVLRLNWQDISDDRQTVKYHVSKTDEWMVMPLHERVAAMLIVRGVGRVFPWRDKSNFYKRLRPLCKKVGVAFTPHQARHSFATWLAASGASPKEIMEAGAWRDHKSILRYVKVDAGRVRSLINKIRT